MPEAHDLAFKILLVSDDSFVGGAADLGAAAALASAIFTRDGAPVYVVDTAGGVQLWTGPLPAPEPPPSMQLSADVNDSGQTVFQVGGIGNRQGTFDPGDGSATTALASLIEHTYEQSGSYEVVARTDDGTEERMWVSVTLVEIEPLDEPQGGA